LLVIKGTRQPFGREGLLVAAATAIGLPFPLLLERAAFLHRALGKAIMLLCRSCPDLQLVETSLASATPVQLSHLAPAKKLMHFVSASSIQALIVAHLERFFADQKFSAFHRVSSLLKGVLLTQCFNSVKPDSPKVPLSGYRRGLGAVTSLSMTAERRSRSWAPTTAGMQAGGERLAG